MHTRKLSCEFIVHQWRQQINTEIISSSCSRCSGLAALSCSSVCLFVFLIWLYWGPKIASQSSPFSHGPDLYTGSNGSWKSHFAFYFPPLVWSIQAKLQLTDARQWPIGCRPGSSAKPGWAFGECLCARVCLWKWVHRFVCVSVLLFVTLLCLVIWGIFRFLCASICTVTNPEPPPSHLTTTEAWSGKR